MSRPFVVMCSDPDDPSDVRCFGPFDTRDDALAELVLTQRGLSACQHDHEIVAGLPTMVPIYPPRTTPRDRLHYTARTAASRAAR